MSNKEDSQLKLDPGVPQRRSASGCKCLLWTGGVFIVLFAIFGVVGIVSTVRSGLRAPHPYLYENKTLEEVKDRSLVVRPLVDEAQKFDIIATVWVRGREDTMNDRIDAASSAVFIAEEVVYTDTIFRGVGLKDSHLYTDIALRIPLKGFNAKELTNHDLRASFVLIPTSPSLLDNLINYSHWAPADLTLPPSRSWRGTNGFRTLIDDAIDSFGISIPLLDFHNIKSLCPTESTEEGTGLDRDQLDEELEAGDASSDTLGNLFTTKGKPVLDNHPYVVTRTQLRVLDMTKIYNRKAYNRLHTKLKTDCSQPPGPMPSKGWMLCHRDFQLRANAETRLQLDIPNEKTGKSRTEWAYAPFMYVTPYSWGPLDLFPVPVNREKCQPSETSPNLTLEGDDQFMNVTWHVSYSGSTPDKVTLGTIMGRRPQFNMTDTVYNRAQAQEKTKFLQRVHGHKYSSDEHIGRVFILMIVQSIVQFIAYLIQIHYWYTRSTTVGISILGAALSALSLFVAYPVGILNSSHGNDWGFFSWAWAFLFSAPTQVLLPLAIVKAIFRIGFRWWRFIPLIKLEPSSHRERASARLDARTNWAMKFGIAFGIFAFHYTASLRDYRVISDIGPTADPLHGAIALYSKIRLSLMAPAAFTGEVFQLIMNHRSRTFSGKYKTTVVLTCLDQLAEIAVFFPLLVGRQDYRSGFKLVELLNFVLLSTTVYQAFTLSNVSQSAEDDTD